jgi:uncharacterized protein (UPF0333 family)
MWHSLIKGLLIHHSLVRTMARAQSRTKGQGVVEYAGALVVGALLIAAVIAVAPFGMTETFTSILASITKTLTSKL